MCSSFTSRHVRRNSVHFYRKHLKSMDYTFSTTQFPTMDSIEALQTTFAPSEKWVSYKVLTYSPFFPPSRNIRSLHTHYLPNTLWLHFKRVFMFVLPVSILWELVNIYLSIPRDCATYRMGVYLIVKWNVCSFRTNEGPVVLFQRAYRVLRSAMRGKCTFSRFPKLWSVWKGWWGLPFAEADKLNKSW